MCQEGEVLSTLTCLRVSREYSEQNKIILQISTNQSAEINVHKFSCVGLRIPNDYALIALLIQIMTRTKCTCHQEGSVLSDILH